MLLMRSCLFGAFLAARSRHVTRCAVAPEVGAFIQKALNVNSSYLRCYGTLLSDDLV